MVFGRNGRCNCYICKGYTRIETERAGRHGGYTRIPFGTIDDVTDARVEEIVRAERDKNQRRSGGCWGCSERLTGPSGHPPMSEPHMRSGEWHSPGIRRRGMTRMKFLETDEGWRAIELPGKGRKESGGESRRFFDVQMVFGRNGRCNCYIRKGYVRIETSGRG